MADTHSGSPRAGFGQEIIIVPTLEIPPTNATGILNQSGPEPADVIPADSNVSRGVDIGFVGSLNESSTFLSSFPLHVRIVDLTAQSYQRAHPSQVSALSRFTSSVLKHKHKYSFWRPSGSATGRVVTPASTPPSVYARFRDPGLPRFTFATDSEFSGSQTRVVRTKLFQFPKINMYLPHPNEISGGPSGTWKVYKDTVPCLFHDAENDRLIVFAVYNNNNTFNGLTPIMKLGALIYKQGTMDLAGSYATNGSDFWVNGGVSKQLWNTGTSLFSTPYPVRIRDYEGGAPDVNYSAPATAAVSFNGNIYVIVTDVENFDGTSQGGGPGEDDNGSEGCGGFYVTVYNDTDPIDDRFRPIVGPVKPSRAFATRVKGVSVAALRDSCVVAIDAKIKLDSGNFLNLIQYSRSSDMKNWGGEKPGQSQTFTLGGLDPVELPDAWKPRDVDINPTTGRGWAVTADSEILFTSDNGRTWEIEEEFDSKIDLYSVCCTRNIPGGNDSIPYEAFAFTMDGTTLRRTEVSGVVKWEITASANIHALVGQEDLIRRKPGTDDPEPLREIRNPMPPIPVRGIARQDGADTRVWIAGGSVFKYSHNGGNSFYYMDTIEFDSGNEFGDIEFINKITAGGNRYRLILSGKIVRRNGDSGQLALMNHTIVASARPFAEIKVGSANTKDENDYPIKDTRFISDVFYARDLTRVYYGGHSGCLGEIIADTIEGSFGSIDFDETLIKLIQSDTTTDITSVFWYTNTAEPPDEILLFTDAAGVLWRAPNVVNNQAVPWVRFAVDGSYISRIVYAEDGTDNILISTDHGLYIGSVFASQRVYPSLIALPNLGHYLMACVALPDAGSTVAVNRVEIWRSTDNGMTFTLDDNQPEGAQWFASSALGRPTLTVMHDDSLLLIIDGEDSTGQKKFWSHDDGQTWMLNTDPAVSTPLAGIDVTDSTPNNASSFTNLGSRAKTRTAVAYGGGPLYQAWTSAHTASIFDRMVVYRSFDWKTMPYADIGKVTTPNDYAVPVIVPGRPMWIGFDDLRVSFSGLPSIEDSWTVGLRYRYDLRNIAIESPSIFYRSKNNTSAIFIRWQRNHPDAIAAMGDGLRFAISSFAMFGTNFAGATLRLSKPSYFNSNFPSNVSADTIQFTLESVIEAGVISSSPSSSIIKDATRQWVPHQYKPAYRQYYCVVYNSGSPSATSVHPILDNTETTLILDTQATVPSINSYYIYGDRMWCSGIGGVLNSVVQPDLYNTDNQFCQWIELEIPVQNVPLDEFGNATYTIGTVLAGIKTPLTVVRSPDGSTRHRFNRGFGWQASANISEEIGLSGVASYEQFGRVAQGWELQYQYIKWWDRDYTFRGLVDKPKRAFGFVWDDQEDHSIELVRLVNPPSFTHVCGEWYDFQMGLVEVV